MFICVIPKLTSKIREWRSVCCSKTEHEHTHTHRSRYHSKSTYRMFEHEHIRLQFLIFKPFTQTLLNLVLNIGLMTWKSKNKKNLTQEHDEDHLIFGKKMNIHTLIFLQEHTHDLKT